MYGGGCWCPHAANDENEQLKEDPMRYSSLILAIVLFSLAAVVSCESGQTGGGSKKASSAPDAPLFAPASSKARMDNDEGVGHYQQGHWDVAAGHFAKAVKADPNSAVAHYNFALTQDKIGKHEEATASFKKALELASNDTTIKESEILKKHVGM
jgi:Tfp pilus assembly protein PilF